MKHICAASPTFCTVCLASHTHVKHCHMHNTVTSKNVIKLHGSCYVNELRHVLRAKVTCTSSFIMLCRSKSTSNYSIFTVWLGCFHRMTCWSGGLEALCMWVMSAAAKHCLHGVNHGFITFFCVTVAMHVTARDIRVI